MKAEHWHRNVKTKGPPLPLAQVHILEVKMMMFVLGRPWGLLGVSFRHYSPCSNEVVKSCNNGRFFIPSIYTERKAAVKS